MRVRPAAAVAIAAAVGLAVSLGVLVGGPSGRDASSVPSSPPPEAGAERLQAPPVTGQSSPGGSGPGEPGAADVGRASADLESLAARSGPPGPARLAVPALDLDLPVRPAGVRADRQMQLPPNPAVLGWYRFGASPFARQPGATVVAGHLDSLRFGLGPLVRLRDAAVGDRVLVSDPQGRTVRYAVTEVRRYDRQALPAELFERTGPPRLHLITCGGEYDADAGGYQQNLVVTAEPRV